MRPSRLAPIAAFLALVVAGLSLLQSYKVQEQTRTLLEDTQETLTEFKGELDVQKNNRDGLSAQFRKNKEEMDSLERQVAQLRAAERTDLKEAVEEVLAHQGERRHRDEDEDELERWRRDWPKRQRGRQRAEMLERRMEEDGVGERDENRREEIAPEEPPQPRRKAFLGVATQQIDDHVAHGLNYENEGGLLITYVVPGSAASRARIQRRDILMAVNGEALEDTEHLRTVMNKLDPGATLHLKVFRKGEEMEMEVHLVPPRGDR